MCSSMTRDVAVATFISEEYGLSFWSSGVPPLGQCLHFPQSVSPYALHPILFNNGAWGIGVKRKTAHEWKGTNWHVAFCEVSAQPLDRRLPFANEHSCLSVSALLCPLLLSPLQLCASPDRSVDHRCSVNRETHSRVIKAAGSLILYQWPPTPLHSPTPPFFWKPTLLLKLNPVSPIDHCSWPVLPLAVLTLSNDAFLRCRVCVLQTAGPILDAFFHATFALSHGSFLHLQENVLKDKHKL